MIRSYIKMLYASKAPQIDCGALPLVPPIQRSSEILRFQSFFAGPSVEICLHFAPLGQNKGGHQFLNWWQQYATGILRFGIRISPQKEITGSFKRNFPLFGPSVEIRTRGLLNPIQARYQTSPHPDALHFLNARVF